MSKSRLGNEAGGPGEDTFRHATSHRTFHSGYRLPVPG
jgi:hypothetical protein